MAIYQYGALNTTALTVPGLYVQIVPPQTVLLNGVPSNIGGVVGTASWGPVNAPTIFNGVVDGSQIFGPMNNRLNDIMSHVNVACLQGAAGQYVGVRVTDGTDTAATGAIGNAGSLAFWQALAQAVNTGYGTQRGPSNVVTAVATPTGLIFTAKYTGSLGNSGIISLTSGGAANSWRLVFTIKGAISEIFDNLGAAQSVAVAATGNIIFSQQPTTGQTITLNGTVCTAVPSGAVSPQFNIGLTLQGTLSNFLLMANTSADAQLVKFKYGIGATTLFLTATATGVGGNSLTTVTNITGATASGATLSGGQAAITPPTVATAVMSGGTDGATTITTSTMIGVDSLPRTGMYCLRKMNCSAAILCDLSDSTSFAAQEAFGQAEGILMGITTPSGDTIANAVTTKQNAGIDNPWVKYLFGDWISFNDTTNGLIRTISPQGFWLGKRINLSPERSTLNKEILGIVSTQRSASNLVYQDSDISQLYQSGLEVIANPSPGGFYFSCRTGRNSSSPVGTHGENYTTMTDFIAATINAGMGIYIGELQSLQKNDKTRAAAAATLNSFLANLAAPGGDVTQAMIDSWQVVLDRTNNSATTIGLGYMFAYCKVIYLSVIEFFIINLEGGQTVTITTSNTAPF
jgi:uncharacterized protein